MPQAHEAIVPHELSEDEQHQAKLEYRQAWLGRIVDIGAELFAMAAAVAYADNLGREQPERRAEAQQLAELFCTQAKRRADALFRALWHNDDGYRKSYLTKHPGFYLTADAGYRDEDGYLYIMSRIDDIINVAGHRLSTGAMEEILASHPDVAECAVVGVADDYKGQVPLGFVVLKAGVERGHDEIEGELVALVRERIGPVASFKTAQVVPALPKTRSGKTLRRAIQALGEGRDPGDLTTIEDPSALEQIRQALRA